MIHIFDKHNCCGCSSCVQSCPKQCIRFDEDDQGFRYPVVDKDQCINCGLCEKVCPFLNQGVNKVPIKVYAAINPNESIRKISSSGGLFSLLAEKVLFVGGVVFGARFDDNWEVVHDFAEDNDKLDSFRGSKYLQSRIGETYKQAREFLNLGRTVLFSGTGCQIAGLKRFLGKEYENLIAVEIVCHSVPSPLVWRKYLQEICNGNTVQNVNFRDKSSGWSRYSYSIVVKHSGGNLSYSEPASGIYMKGLTSNLTTRPSCSQCPSRYGKSGADIVLGDCWGIWDLDTSLDDNKGTSLVVTYTQKGEEFVQELGLELREFSMSELPKYNAGLEGSYLLHPMHDRFFAEISKHNNVQSLMQKYLNPQSNSIINKIKKFIVRIKRMF